MFLLDVCSQACIYPIPFLLLFEFFLLYCPIAGPYAALTLQGPPPSAASLPLEPLSTDLAPIQKSSLGGEAPPPPPPPLPCGLSSTPSQRITGPKPLQVNERMLRIYVILQPVSSRQPMSRFKIDNTKTLLLI